MNFKFFEYTVYRLKRSNRFLVVRTGGIAGVFEVYETGNSTSAAP